MSLPTITDPHQAVVSSKLAKTPRPRLREREGPGPKGWEGERFLSGKSKRFLRKQFFSEEKNQKTFIPGPAARSRPWPPNLENAEK
jgi:hypothetical protein